METTAIGIIHSPPQRATGTPLLGLKPYVPAFDAFQAKRIGWCAQVREFPTATNGRFETGETASPA